MNSLQSRRKVKKNSNKRKKNSELSNTFSIKLFVSMGLLLIILLMQKYDLSIGQFNVDSIYDVVYHNEDLNAIKDRIFFLDDNKADATLDQPEDQTIETFNNTTNSSNEEATSDVTDKSN